MKKRTPSSKKGIQIEILFTFLNQKNQDKKQDPAYGVDVLRMWAAYGDYSKDVEVGRSILKKVAESLRKVRNTLRFCLGNLYDFQTTDLVAYQQLPEVIISSFIQYV